MSKRFKTQDYFRYKKLGIRWRKPRGRQSKLRIKKGGSGLRPGVGYGTEKSRKYLVCGLVPVIVSNVKQLDNLNETHGIIIGGTTGMKNTAVIYNAAKEKGMSILNMKKMKRALKKEGQIRKRQEQKAAKTKPKEVAGKTEEKG